MEPVGIELTAVIRALREQLSQAAEESQDKDVRFRVEKVNLEAEVAVTREAGGGVGIRVLGVSADGKTTTSTVATQRLSLELTAMTSNGDPLDTGVVRKRRD